VKRVQTDQTEKRGGDGRLWAAALSDLRREKGRENCPQFAANILFAIVDTFERCICYVFSFFTPTFLIFTLCFWRLVALKLACLHAAFYSQKNM